jgi:hypothetical protein
MTEKMEKALDLLIAEGFPDEAEEIKGAFRRLEEIDRDLDRQREMLLRSLQSYARPVITNTYPESPA